MPMDHFRGRKVEIVEAVYDIIGYYKHQNNLDVLYVDTTMPHVKKRRQLKNADALGRLDPTSTDIYTRTRVQKYQDRGVSVFHLTIKKYFKVYQLNYSQQERRGEESENNEEELTYAGEFDPGYRSRHNFNTTVAVGLDGRRIRVPKFTRDSYNYIFKARNKMPLIRHFNTNPQHGEAFYYQQIILNFPCQNFDASRNNLLWKD